MPTINIPIAIVAFDRPEYLGKFLESLASQRDFDTRRDDIYLFLDGPVNAYSRKVYAEQSNIDRCEEVFRTILPNGAVFKSPNNIGVFENFDRAERFMYDDVGAEVAYFFEDDLVLSPFYLDVMGELWGQIRHRDDIAYFSAYGFHEASLAEQERRSREVCPLQHHWGFGLKRSDWKRITQLLEPCYQILRGVDYRERPVEKIQEWVWSLGVYTDGTSQDYLKAIAANLLGKWRLQTFACWGRYIGENGLHFRPDSFKALGFGETVLLPRPERDFEIPDSRRVAQLVAQERALYRDLAIQRGVDLGSPSLRLRTGPLETGGAAMPIDSVAAGRAADEAVATGLRRRELGDLDEAAGIFLAGVARFPDVLDKFGHPVFVKEAFRTLLVQGALEVALKLRDAWQAERGPPDWSRVILARHLSSIASKDALSAWRQALSAEPGHAEALARIKELEDDLSREVADQLTPRMPADDLALLMAVSRTRRKVVEFGCGGSTLAMLRNGVDRVNSVESDPAWIARLAADAEIGAHISAGRVALHHADIGAVGAWGTPVDRTSMEKWPSYWLDIWGLVDRRSVSLVFVDGRFRVACALSAYLFSNDDCLVALHDYPGRPQYMPILEYFTPVAESSTLTVFSKKKRQSDASDVMHLLMRHAFETD